VDTQTHLRFIKQERGERNKVGNRQGAGTGPPVSGRKVEDQALGGNKSIKNGVSKTTDEDPIGGGKKVNIQAKRGVVERKGLSLP